MAVTVLGGYLGAGKSTVVNHVLAHAAGRRIGVLVNDIGEINVDASLIESVDGEVVSLANGCVCCTLTDGFAAALDALRGRHLDNVIVECSGVADPAAVAAHTHAPGFQPNGVVVVADAVHLGVRLTDRYVGATVARQLATADLVVMAKSDLVADLSAAQSLVRRHNAAAPLIATAHGRIDPDILFGVEPSGVARAPFVTAAHRVATTRFGAPLEPDELDALIAALDPGVMRAKGFFDVVGEAERRVVIQVVGRTVTRSLGPKWRSGEPRMSAWVVISTG